MEEGDPLTVEGNRDDQGALRRGVTLNCRSVNSYVTHPRSDGWLKGHRGEGCKWPLTGAIGVGSLVGNILYKKT